jgi:hypothetical protein
MNDYHLRKILLKGLYENNNVEFDEVAFGKMYNPKYEDFLLDEVKLNRQTVFLVFDYKKFNFDFKSCKISCTGVEIRFSHKNYDTIICNVSYDAISRKLYNSLLIIPKYTMNDYMGRKTIKQSAKRVDNNNAVEKYIKSIHKRFECVVS